MKLITDNKMECWLKNENGPHLYKGPLYSANKELTAWFKRGLSDGYSGNLYPNVLTGDEVEAYFFGLQIGTRERSKVAKARKASQ